MHNASMGSTSQPGTRDHTMTATLSKTAAIREASTHCSISGRGTSWTIYGPYSSSNPSGPSTESHADSYPKALKIRAAWRARIALHLMGRLNDDTRFAVEEAAYGGSQSVSNVRDLVDAGLKAVAE